MLPMKPTASARRVSIVPRTTSEGGTEAGEEDGDHVTICHRPPGCPGNTRTITVGQCAVGNHLAHGDSLGACPECSNDDDCNSDVCAGELEVAGK